MLPSKGYFNSLECPFYLSSTNCQRPYCHFKHPKRDLKQDTNEEKGENVVEDQTVDWRSQISTASAPEVHVVAPVKHIPIAFIPTKPSAISVNTKKPKSSLPQYVPTIKGKDNCEKKKNETLGSSNPFGSFDYDPSSFMDSSEKTYSRYSYEKGHDSGDEIMENHKSIIETNHIKLDEGSKSGYDEETDDFGGDAEFSPPISPRDEEDEEQDLLPTNEPSGVAAFADIAQDIPMSNNEPGLNKDPPGHSKCKKKRKYSEISQVKSVNDVKKNESTENSLERQKEKTDKSGSRHQSKSSSPKRIKLEKDTNHSTETDTKKSEKKVCKYKDKKRSTDKSSSEGKTNTAESKNQIVEDKKHLGDSKKHSSNSDSKKHSSDKKHSDKKEEVKHTNRTHSSEQKKHPDAGKKQETKGTSSTESGKKHSPESKKHSSGSKKQSSESKTQLVKDLPTKKHVSETKNHSSQVSKKSSSEKHTTSSSKKHSSSSNHKKQRTDSEKTSSSSDKSKKHPSEVTKKPSSSSRSHSDEKKQTEDNRKHSEKKNNKEKHSKSKETTKHKSDDDKKVKLNTYKSGRDSESSERSRSKAIVKRKYSDSSDSVISADEKKETILISDSSEAEDESEGGSESPPRVEDILGLSDSDHADDTSLRSTSENEDEYTPMHMGGAKASTPTYKPSPISSSRRACDQAEVERSFIQAPSSTSDEYYTKPTTSSKIRIAHVPNVSSLLSAKTLIGTGKTVPPALQKIVTATHIINPRPPSRVAPANTSTSLPRPQVTTDLEAVVASNIRQPGLNNIFDELIKFVDYNEAYRRSVEEEKEICNVATNPQSYRNRVALCILRIRKSKGAVDVVKKERITSSSVPDYTYGLTLYECFSKYLLKPEEYVLHGYPLELPGKPGFVYIDKSSFFRNKHTGPTEGPFRKCINCGQEYAVDEETGMPLTKDDCHHHWGKPIGMRQGKIYTCCKSEVGSEPCHISMYHVTELKNDDCLKGFVRTKPYPAGADPIKAGIFAMDCEMCFTTKGRDIVRASLLAVDNESVYDVLIKPKDPILDYCTRFSGITEEKLANVTTTLEDVQKFLLKTISDKTILVGHSLENDLKALKLIHYNVVDTSIMFPHKEGLPVKCALRTLCSRILGTAIQTGENGHDSLEDSRACLQLVLHQVREDAKSRKPRVVKQLKSK